MPIKDETPAYPIEPSLVEGTRNALLPRIRQLAFPSALALAALFGVTVGRMTGATSPHAEQARPSPKKTKPQPEHDYRDALLLASVRPLQEIERWNDLTEVQREKVEEGILYHAEVARTFPPGDDGLRLLIDATDYFDFPDAFVAWDVAKLQSTHLAEEGVTISPKEAMAEIVQIAKRISPARPKTKMDCSTISSLHHLARRRHNADGTTDQQIIDIVVEQFSRPVLKGR